MESRFWLNLQAEYDIRVATRKSISKLMPRIRVYRASAA
jgi:plasmid maintenance system antidote protein VapI